MYRIYLTLSLFFLLSVGKIQAQQMPQTVNFMYNQLVYNPAAAGMHETEFNANMITRFQWGGKSRGGPTTNLLWADYKFAGNKMAVGLNVNYDKFGASSNMQVLGNYAYYVNLSNKLSMSMGLRFGVTSLRYNATNLTAWDVDDPTIAALNVHTMYPTAGTGIQFQYNKKLYAGLSVPDLITVDKYNLYDNKDRSFFQKRRNYIFMSGYKLKINDTYDLYPNLRVIYYPSGAVRADMNMIFDITDYFWAGVTYSTSQNHALMAGTHISSRVRFSYAYEFNAKSSVAIPLSTHEINIMLNLDDLFKH